MNPFTESSLGRREAIKRMAAAAMLPALGSAASAQESAKASVYAGTASDPDLLKPVIPWKTTLTEPELKTLAALCDMILPADDRSPSASDVGVPDFIDEWISAPYPVQQADLPVVRGGLAWLNTECDKLFSKRFHDLDEAGRTTVCDLLAYLPNAKPEHRVGALMFSKVRELSMLGFYTTKEGMKDAGYEGNRALAKWEGPPPEVLAHLNLL